MHVGTVEVRFRSHRPTTRKWLWIELKAAMIVMTIAVCKQQHWLMPASFLGNACLHKHQAKTRKERNQSLPQPAFSSPNKSVSVRGKLRSSLPHTHFLQKSDEGKKSKVTVQICPQLSKRSILSPYLPVLAPSDMQM